MYRHRQALTFTVAALATSCCDGFNSYPPRGMRVRLHHGLSSTLADSATERANQLQQPVYDPFIASHVQGAGFRPRSFTAEEAEAARAPARVPPLAETPSKRDVMAAVPVHCFQRSTAKSLLYAAGSVAATLACGVAGQTLIPAALAALQHTSGVSATAAVALAAPLLWTTYALVTGTVATGCWVIAHECGHNAFSDNKKLQTIVGFTLHSLLLVPYFSWQRTHAVHHLNTNHMTEGETHVPMVVGSAEANDVLAARRRLGKRRFAVTNLVGHLLFGCKFSLLRYLLQMYRLTSTTFLSTPSTPH